jgi:hypothetical protein
MADGITYDRVADEQRLQGDQVVDWVTATVRIDGKGPFFYRAKKTSLWRSEMEQWAALQAADVRALIG